MTALLYAVILFTATLVGPSLGQYGPPTKGKKQHHVTVTSTLPPDVANLNYNPISTPLPDNSLGSVPESAGGGSYPGASFPIGTVSQPAQQPSPGAGCGGVGSGCTAGQSQRDPTNPFPFLNSIKPTALSPVVSCSVNGYACVPKNLCRNGIATSAGHPQTNSCNTQTHECCQVSNIGQPGGIPVQGGCAGVKGGSCSTGVFQQPGSPTGTRPSYVTGSISPSPNPPSYASGSQNPSASFPSNSFKPGPSSGVPGSNGIPIGGSIYDGSSYPVTQSPNEKPYTGPLNTTPHPGCAAALKCVPETYCDAEGVMVSQPVFLTREQAENRVPMTDCQDPDTGIIGKCCRDPNYKDPWPGGMMNNGDITECSAGSICQLPDVCGDQNKVRPFQNCLIPSSGRSGMCCYVGGQQSGGAILPSGVKPLKKPTPGYPSVQPFPQQQIPVQPSPGSPSQPLFPQQPPSAQPLPQKPSSVKPFPTQQTLPQKFPTIQPLPLKPSSIKPISEQTPSQQPLPQQYPVIKPLPQKPSSVKPYPQQLPTQQSPSAQPFPQQPSYAQPFPQQTPSAQPFPQQSPSAQPFPQQTPSAQPFPQRPSSAQPFPQQTPSAQPFPQQPSSAQPFPQQLPSAQPFPQQVPSAQPFPQQLPSAQPFPQQVPSAQPFPQQLPSAQPFPQQVPSAQPFPQQLPSAQPFPQQVPSAQPFPQKPPSSQTFPQKPSGTQYFPNQSPSLPPFSQKPTSAQPLPQHGSTAQPFPQKPVVASPFPQQSISSQPFPQKPASIQPFPQQFPSAQTPHQQPIGSQPYPRPSAKPFPQQPQTSELFPQQSPSSQPFPQQQPQSQSTQGSQFPVPGTSQIGSYPSGDQSSQSFVPQQQPGYYTVVPGEKCGVRRPVNRQGLANTDAGFGEFPWQALIMSNFNQKALCSAAIVSDRAVVTAAHCLQGLESSDISVKAGVWKLHSAEQPKPVQEVEAAAIARHPKFDAGPLFNDLAIVLLEEPLHFDEHVDTICFQSQPDISQYSQCIATGWGKAALQGNVHGSVLHQIPVQMISRSVCEEKLRQTNLGRYFILNPSFQCAVPTDPAEDLCKVDAGGPIACHKGDARYELAGVYSWDVGCATTQNPTAFGGIDTEWIRSVLSRPIDDVARDELNEILRQQQQQELSGVDIDSKPGFSQGYGKK